MQQLIIMGLASFNPGTVAIQASIVKKCINSLDESSIEPTLDVRLIVSHRAAKIDSSH